MKKDQTGSITLDNGERTKRERKYEKVEKWIIKNNQDRIKKIERGNNRKRGQERTKNNIKTKERTKGEKE